MGLFEKGGVKGIHPLGCLPLWGSEGVTLILGLKYSCPLSLFIPQNPGQGR
jgi:hypothetical protein